MVLNEELIKKIAAVIAEDITPQISMEAMEEFYQKGIEQMEVKFDMNFVQNKQNIQFLARNTMENISDMNNELASKVRKVLNQSLLNGESIDAMRVKLQEVMEIGRERARMIARTETNRALNVAHKDAAKQMGVPMVKYLAVAEDERTSIICRELDAKYGSAEKAIGLDDKFIFEGDEYDLPPFHVNCRTRVVYRPDI